MKKYLPYSRVCRGIAVLGDPSAYKPDNSPLNDEVAVQGVILSISIKHSIHKRTLDWDYLLHLLQFLSTKTNLNCPSNGEHTCQLRSILLPFVRYLANRLAVALHRLVSKSQISASRVSYH